MAERIDAVEAREELARGEALLVCAYGDEAKCGRLRLAGALSMAELHAREPALPKDQRLLFYCA